ncbi:MAG TPA: TonB-dependent receptor plug domain-containing protein, partial [Bradyrhizobium sp.]|nr:TonB-dependent receptor plug domain-containing protein [Bradyrhizobium sp.]
MFRFHALCGVSVAAIQVALIASADVARAQGSPQALPPVTVEAPKPQLKRPVKKPERAVAVMKRLAAKRHPSRPTSTPAPQPPVIAANPAGSDVNASLAAPPVKQRFQLPQESYSITSKQIEETINLKDPEDAVKYMPSLFVRKRNDGDNQAVLATRTWGLNSSARSLIYYDDLLVSALINNNNQNGSPHWNLISPDAIQRVDFLDGPFAAAYPGNSIGGVLIYTSKMPDHVFATAKETVSVMPWSQYGTKDTYTSSNTTASAGNRTGAFSWLLSVNYQDSWQQPLTYTTSSTIPAGTTGAFPALNKQGLPANVIGTGTLAYSQQTSANLRLAYDVTPFVQATYSLGIWNNHQISTPQTYLTSTATGAPTFAGNSSFASNRYIWDETHLSNAVSIKSNTKGVFDFDLSASSYNYLQDIQFNPFTVTSTGVGYSTNGKITRMDGTNWQNADAKGIWRPFGFDGPQEVSFGLHGDRYQLENPAYASAIWNNTPSTGTGQLYSDGEGETRTGALWVQDAWKIVPNLKLTLGGRLESWEAINGYNLNTTTNSSGLITSTAAI